MKRTLVALAALAPLSFSPLLAGCGSEPDVPVAEDPATTAAPTPTPTPTAEPTVGSYPDFAPSDYSYTLVVSCFCADAGAPVRITVVDDAVTRAVYAGDGRGVERGEEAPDYRHVTIDEVIAAANDTEAARVDVEWPDGQDFPTSVYVDQDEQMADEEIGYTLSDVEVG